MPLNLDNIPDSINVDITGQRTLYVKDCKAIVCKTGAKELQFTYGVEGSDTEIRYDNCVIYKADGSDNVVGQIKMKKLLNVMGVKIEGNFTPKVVCPLVLGKKFIADVVKNDKGYNALSEDYRTYLPVGADKSTENIQADIAKHEAEDNIFPEPVQQPAPTKVFSEQTTSEDEGWD